MRILITGANGFIGSHLTHALARQRHEVYRLSRSQPDPNDPRQFHWDPAAGLIDDKCLEGVDAVIHLAGEGIADRRWNEAVKQAIVQSRVRGTQVLLDAIGRRTEKPRAFIAAAAIGFYGDRGAEELDERSPAGTGFLAETCQAWEAATAQAAGLGLRLVQARIGVVLGKEGGALAKMLLPFKLGLGGRVGSGQQFMSWITVHDLVRAFLFFLEHPETSGVYNVTAPNPVNNAQFTLSLGRALSRPTLFPMPAFAARLAFGELADDLLIGGQKVMPARLKAAGFQWESPFIGEGLSKVLAS
jgi:uncharacterized protein (TIGR01777 family)